jgi:carboxyl-terminal processing protease
MSKKLTLIIGSIIVTAGIFLSGFYVGQTRVPALYAVQGVANKELSQPEQVDFGLFWEVWKLLDEKYAPAGTDVVGAQDRVYGAIEGLVASLGDPYTAFLPPIETEVFEGDVGGSFAGIGMEIANKDGLITVVSPLKNTPAERAGIKSGDRIIAVDGEQVVDFSIERVVSMIRGEMGKTVTLTIFRDGEDGAFDVAVVRDTIQIPTIETTLRDDNVFVIQLFNFSAPSPKLFMDALREYTKSGSKDLIIDLRGNPGGFLDASIEIASNFLAVGEIIVTEGTGSDSDKIHRSRGYKTFDGDLVVLIDGGSASASEILVGALKDHGLATIVGTHTFGKGSVQEFLKVNDDTALKVTVARWFTPNKVSISDGGLIPDEIIDFDADKYRDGIDVQLEKAVEVLLSK